MATYMILNFLTSADNLSLAYASSYDYSMVTASVLIAIFSSYCSFEIVARLGYGPFRHGWILLATFLLGIGIWSMHFISMLAFRIDCEVSYDPWITLVSILPGFFAATIALYSSTLESVSYKRLVYYGIILGMGISLMHYTGMGAIRLNGFLRYDRNLFLISIMAAIVLSIAALIVKSTIKRSSISHSQYISSLLSGIILGTAISSMHYIAMLSTFFIHDGVTSTSASISPLVLSVLVGLSVTILVIFGMVFMFFGSRLANERKRIEAILAHTSEGLIVIDAENYVVRVNQALLDMIGCTSNHQIVGHLANQFFDSDQYQGNFHEKLELRCVNGSSLPCLASGNTVIDADGLTKFSFVLFSDLSAYLELEKNLQNSQQRLKYAMDASQDGIWDWHIQTHEAEFSTSYYHMLGFEADEFPASEESWIGLLHPSERDQVLASQIELLKLKSGFEMEFRMRAKDGTYKWVLSRGMVVEWDSHHEPLRVVGTLTEQTKRKQLELNLAQSNQELSAIFNSAGVGIVYLQNRIIIRANRKIYEMFGYEDRELIGKPTRIWYVDEADYTTIDEKVAEILTKGGIFTLEMQQIRKDGTIFWARIIIQALDIENPSSGILGILQDITLEREAKNILIESKHQIEESHRLLEQQSNYLQGVKDRLKLATQAAQIGIWVWEFSSDSIEWDYLMHQFYDAPSDAVINYNFWKSRVHPEDIARVEDKLAKAKACNTIFDETFRIVLPDSRIRHIAAGSIIEFNQQGKPIRMVGINRDVTEVREQEDKLMQARLAAETANSAKSAFLANMSHEFRTPMNAIIGLSSLVLGTELTAQQRDYLSRVVNASKSLLYLIDDILDYSKIEAGHLKFEYIAFRLWDVIGDTINIFKIKLEEKNLKLVTIVDPNIPDYLVGDSLRLGQVLKNLVGNAVKFTQHGEIGIKVSLEPTSDPSTIMLHFAVRDTGIGIAQERTQQLFSPFTQADVSITKKFGGTGLGLSISKRIVELMQGELSVSSEEGKGSTFSFTAYFGHVDMQNITESLVMLRHDGANLIADYSRLAAPIQGADILVVEDDEASQIVMRDYLYKLGLNVFIANNGREAIEYINRQPFDIVLMDLQMPVMGGFEATRIIRDLPEGKSIPIIATTASVRLDAMPFCIDVGINDIVPKPIDPKILLQCLLKWISPRFNITDNNSQSPLEPSHQSYEQSVINKLVDQEKLMPLIDELEQLLEKNMFKAKKMATEVDEILAGTALSTEFSKISSLTRKMRYKDALHFFGDFRAKINSDS